MAKLQINLEFEVIFFNISKISAKMERVNISRTP